MKKRVETVLFRGTLNSNMTVSYMYTWDDASKYKPLSKNTLMDRSNQQFESVKIFPNILLTVSEGYGRPFVSIGNNGYFAFVTLLEKSVKQVSEHLYEIFPDVDKIEFSGDSKMLEIYRTEKALTSANITMFPVVWVNETSQCFPAIKVTTQTQPSGISIPLEDAIAMSKMLSCFDPNSYGLMMLRTLDKI